MHVRSNGPSSCAPSSATARETVLAAVTGTLHTMDRGSAAKGRSRGIAALLVVLAVLSMLGCVPKDSNGATEVDDGSDSAAAGREAPTPPADGALTAEYLIEGLAFDLFDRPADGDYWAPKQAEARCTATAVVDGLGAQRLADLGYRPATVGASLNDVELADDERTLVVAAFGQCLDVEESLAAIFYGGGRMPEKAAACMARTLVAGGHTEPFLLGLATGSAVDPFAGDGALATGLLDGAAVCIDEAAFNWPDVRLDDPDAVIDADAPPGVSNSPYAADRRTDSTPTTSAPEGSGP